MTSSTRSGSLPAAAHSPVTPIAPFCDLLHAAQWGALRAWVDAIPPAILHRPSTLPGWTIDQLLSHLATGVDTIAALVPADHHDAEQPLPVLEYLTGYRHRAAAIRQRSTRTAADRNDRAAELDDAWSGAGRTLPALGGYDVAVRAPGGPIRLQDFLLTRLIELVVHGMDLRLSVRALENAGPVVEPLVLPLALSRAAAALRNLCVQKYAERSDAPDASVSLNFADVFGSDLHDVRLVLLASGRERDHAGLSAELQSVLPLF